MQIKDIDKLKEWLLKKLEPLCDADPAALAKYVVALLRKEKPKAALKELCIDQLEVFLAKETGGFVEQLFRGLDNDSYLKSEPVEAPTSTKTAPSEGTKTNESKTTSTTTVSPPVPPTSIDRRQSEDQFRKNEVDDEDRDFRRSRRGVIGGSRGNNESVPSRRVVSTVTSSTGGGGLPSGIGRKRRMDIVQENSQGAVRRRVMIDQSKVDSDNQTNTAVTSSSSGGGPKRPVRERLGVRQEDSRSSPADVRGRRYHRGRSSSSSSSSSDSGSSSDSDRRGRGRKKKRYSKTRSSSTEGRRRQRCKDYDKKGFCILGESCPYDHGVDPLVIGGNEITPFPPPPPLVLPPPGMPLPPNAGKPDMMIPPGMPTMPGPMNQPCGMTDGYNPEDPALTSSKSTEFRPVPIVPPMGPRFRPLPPPMPGAAIPPPLSMSSMHHLRPMHFTPVNSFPHHHPRPPPFMGRYMGPNKPSDTLIIRKIPRDMNTITKISSHFEKFGTIVNLTVRYEGDVESALVQFSSPAEATKAHNSTEAVLNNRFIKVFYLKQSDGVRQPPLNDITLEPPTSVAVSVCRPNTDSSTVVSSSIPTTNNLPDPSPDSSSATTSWKKSPKMTHSFGPPSAKSFPTQKTPPTSAVPHVVKRQQKRTAEVAKKSLELQKKTQELLQKQIQQQKLLIAKLEKSGKQLPSEEKAKILSTLQSLSTNISKLKDAATAAKKKADSSKDLSEQKKKHPQNAPVTNSLKEKADALRKEAHKLGLLNSPSQPLPTSGKGPHSRSKPDSKPRKLLVIGVQDRDKLTSYFESFGDLEQVGIDPVNNNNLIFTFRNAYSAGKAVKGSSTFNGKPLIMKWYTPKPSQSPVTATLPTVATNPVLVHNQDGSLTQTSIEDQVTPITTAILTKPNPDTLHLVEDSDDEDRDESRSWKR